MSTDSWSLRDSGRGAIEAGEEVRAAELGDLHAAVRAAGGEHAAAAAAVPGALAGGWALFDEGLRNLAQWRPTGQDDGDPVNRPHGLSASGWLVLRAGSGSAAAGSICSLQVKGCGDGDEPYELPLTRLRSRTGEECVFELGDVQEPMLQGAGTLTLRTGYADDDGGPVLHGSFRYSTWAVFLRRNPNICGGEEDREPDDVYAMDFWAFQQRDTAALRRFAALE